VRDGFEKFIKKRIAGDGEAAELASGAKFLALVLAEREPRKKLIEEYIKELTGESLQSAEEIMRTAAALGLDPRTLGLDVQRPREIFARRNKIIHELDIDRDAKKRKRKVRSQGDLLDNSDFILSTTKTIIESVDKHL